MKGERKPEAGWEARPGLVGKPAADCDSCAFRCPDCGIGFSNAKTASERIRITATPQANVLPEVWSGLAEALTGAINVHNRPTKRQKFCSYNSQDAVTWTVVHGLRAGGTLGALAGEPELGPPSALLLWAIRSTARRRRRSAISWSRSAMGWARSRTGAASRT